MDELLGNLLPHRATQAHLLVETMAATGWQAHSVRGFVSGHVVKRMGLQVKSLRRDGERVYTIKT